MACLGVEPRAAGWKAQTNPLSYGGTPTCIYIHCLFAANSLFIQHHYWKFLSKIILKSFFKMGHLRPLFLFRLFYKQFAINDWSPKVTNDLGLVTSCCGWTAWWRPACCCLGWESMSIGDPNKSNEGVNGALDYWIQTQQSKATELSAVPQTRLLNC